MDFNMITSITHQWQQPLNSIALLSSLLRMNITKIDPRTMDIDDYIKQRDTKIINYNEKIEEQLNFMAQTIDDFKNFLQPDKVKVSFELIDQIELIKRIVEPVLKDKDISLFINDNRSSFDMVIGYPTEFAQAILNLINNSIDAILENNSINRNINVDIKNIDDKVFIMIQDFAGGIKENIIQKIFDNHFTTKEMYGTGVGLYIVKNILNNMNANIAVENKNGGALFTITFKL